MTIHEIARLPGRNTDKQRPDHSFHGLSYLHNYERFFEPLRYSPITLLEIGVYLGESVRLWKDYFPRGRIYGLDIDPATQRHREERIEIIIGSQADDATLARASSHGPFDIIIDDGSHVLKHLLKSFATLWPSVKPGGYYVLEDMGCSYGAPLPCWPGMSYNTPDAFETNDRALFDAELKRLLGQMDGLRGDVAEICLFPMVYFFRKAE